MGHLGKIIIAICIVVIAVLTGILNYSIDEKQKYYDEFIEFADGDGNRYRNLKTWENRWDNLYKEEVLTKDETSSGIVQNVNKTARKLEWDLFVLHMQDIGISKELINKYVKNKITDEERAIIDKKLKETVEKKEDKLMDKYKYFEGRVYISRSLIMLSMLIILASVVSMLWKSGTKDIEGKIKITHEGQ